MRGGLVRAAGLILAVMIVAVLAVGPAYASPAQQTGNSVGGNCYTVKPGQPVEWMLNYNGGDNEALVQVGQGAPNSIRFDVFTNQQWISADTSTPIGKGTQFTQKDLSTGNTVVNNGGDLYWKTGQSAPETYHIQIFSTSNQDASYCATATGAGVSSFAPYSPQSPAMQSQMAMAQPAQAPKPSTTASTGAVAQAGTGTSASQAPRTLPVTGGSELALLFGAGWALIAGGWAARRRSNS